GLIHVDARDITAAAEKARLVFTTAEYRDRQEKAVKALPPLEQGKVYYAKREFDRAIELFTSVLRQKPDQSEALELLGDSHYHCDRFSEAVAAYDQLAQSSVPNIAVQGVFKAAVVYYEQRN